MQYKLFYVIQMKLPISFISFFTTFISSSCVIRFDCFFTVTFLVATFPFHFILFSGPLFGEHNRNKFHSRSFFDMLATFAIKSYRKKLHQVFNKLNQTEIACKIMQKKLHQTFYMKKLHQIFI